MNARRIRLLENALDRFEVVKLEPSGRPNLPIDAFLKRFFSVNAKVSSIDKSWVSQQFYDVLRWQPLLDHQIQNHTWSARLRLFFESDTWKSSARKRDLPPEAQANLPKLLFDRFSKQFGQKKAIHIGHILSEVPPCFLRVNLNLISRDHLLTYLTSKSVNASKSINTPCGITVNNLSALYELPEFRTKKWMEIQDEASQLIGLQVECQPGDKVLDFCAGSGGKSLVFGHKLRGKGKIYLHDVNFYALRDAKSRLKQAGITNYYTLPISEFQTDNKVLNSLKNKCDWVLCDVPSTGTGVSRRDPDLMWKWSDTEDFLWDSVAKQREIVREALQYLKPKGTLVYATQSILDPENVDQVQFFMETYDLELVKKPITVLPQSRGMNGFFCASLKRKPT